MGSNHPTNTGPEYRDADGEPAQTVVCPECHQLEWWTAEECRDHGICRAIGGTCEACGEEVVPGGR